MLQVVRDVKASAAVPQEEEGEVLSLLTGHFANAQRHRRNLPFSAAKYKSLRSISVGWDNYQMLKTAKYETQHKGRKFLMFEVTYAASHRLPSLHLDDEWVTPAARLPPHTWLPSNYDLTQLKWWAIELVKRILVARFNVLEELKAGEV